MREDRPTGSSEKHFGKLSDPRTGNAKQHILLGILIIAICAVICGADGWNDIELFGKNKKAWLKSFLKLPKGIRSHDTFGRAFGQIKPEEFQEHFVELVRAIETLTAGQVIAIDGKQLRRSHDQEVGKAAIYMVSAWATQNQFVLGQTKVADKSNEITAIPEMLQLLEITGCIVTIDAIGTQTEIAETIVDGGGDYLLSVKENQGHLFEDIQYIFNVDVPQGYEHEHSYSKTVNKGHDRMETRECWAVDREEYLSLIRTREQWKDLKSIVRIVSHRQVGEEVEVQTRYFISSLPADAKMILKTKRSHWKIENQLHWVLDIAFREDESRVRKDHAAENLAVLRHMALNLLKKRKQPKAVFTPKAYRLAGTMTTCSRSLIVEMRLPYFSDPDFSASHGENATEGLKIIHPYRVWPLLVLPRLGIGDKLYLSDGWVPPSPSRPTFLLLIPRNVT